MRLAATFGLCLLLTACAAARDEGVMSYDALAEATKACAAKGGSLKLIYGADPQQMANYACKRK
jgi:hypothetical protein